MYSPQAVSMSRQSALSRKFFVGGLSVLLLFVASWCQAQDDDDDDLVETLGKLTLAIEHNPKRADGYRQRGIFWRDVGENGRAVTDFSNAIRLDPASASTYVLRRGDLELARQIRQSPRRFRCRLAHRSEKRSALTRIAAAFGTRGDLDQALADSNAAIRLAPKSAEGYVVRGMVWSTRQEFDKAVRDYDLAIRLDPNNSSAYHNRGVIYQHQGAIDHALADYTSAIKADRGAAASYYFRGMIWLSKHEHDLALHDFNSAVQFDPRNAETYVQRGIVWQRKGKLNQAIKDWSEAIRLDPKNAEAYTQCALGRGTQGEFDKAPARFRRGRAAQPEIMAGLSPAGLDLVNESDVDPPRWCAGRQSRDTGLRTDELERRDDDRSPGSGPRRDGQFRRSHPVAEEAPRTVDPRQSVHDRRRAAAQTLQVEQAVPRRPELATGINQNICPGERGVLTPWFACCNACLAIRDVVCIANTVEDDHPTTPSLVLAEFVSSDGVVSTGSARDPNRLFKDYVRCGEVVRVQFTVVASLDHRPALSERRKHA